VKPALFEVALLVCVFFVVSTFCAVSIARKLLFPLQVSCFPTICGVTEVLLAHCRLTNPFFVFRSFWCCSVICFFYPLRKKERRP
jgi:hypothetical protein